MQAWRCWIINDDSAQTIQVWPNTSDKIDGGAADAVSATAIDAGSSATFVTVDAENWYTADVAAAAAAVAAPNPNLIINGGMTVSQRGTVTSVGASNGRTFGGPDRFMTYVQGSPQGRGTVSQDTTVIASSGQSTSMKWDCTTAESAVAAGDLITIQYRIEGQDVQQFMYATSDAVSITLSFDFQSPKSGTHCVAVYAIDDTTHNIVEFTVASADTMEHFDITIALETTGTAIPDDNTEGFSVTWPLVCGSTYQNTAGSGTGEDYATSNQQNLLDNTANNVILSNVKLEVASAATAFEHESYGETLAKCLRYYWEPVQATNEPVGSGIGRNSTSAWIAVHYPVTMRADPTFSTPVATQFTLYYNNTSQSCTAIASTGYENENGMHLNITSLTSMATTGAIMVAEHGSAALIWDAEL